MKTVDKGGRDMIICKGCPEKPEGADIEKRTEKVKKKTKCTLVDKIDEKRNH
jgi:hypothetical protein